MVNSFIHLSGGEFSFLIGLAIIELKDALFVAFLSETGSPGNFFLTIIAVFLSIAIAGVFVGIGLLARKKYLWAYVAGMTVYALDGVIFLLFLDVFSFGFHVVVLVLLWEGLRAEKKMSSAVPLSSSSSPLPYEEKISARPDNSPS